MRLMFEINTDALNTRDSNTLQVLIQASIESMIEERGFKFSLKPNEKSVISYVVEDI